MKSLDLIKDNTLKATLYFNLGESECRGCNELYVYIYIYAILQELELYVYIYIYAILQELKLSSKL